MQCRAGIPWSSILGPGLPDERLDGDVPSRLREQYGKKSVLLGSSPMHGQTTVHTYDCLPEKSERNELIHGASPPKVVTEVTALPWSSFAGENRSGQVERVLTGICHVSDIS
jgi:hypothetical protein